MTIALANCAMRKLVTGVVDRPAARVTAKPLVPDQEMAPDLGMGLDLGMGAGMGRAVGKAVADRRCPSVRKFWTAQGYVSLRVHL